MTPRSAKLSAGILLFRTGQQGPIEVLIVHPGGPFWANKDQGAWSIPKGEVAQDEDPAEVAEREFAEELGRAAPAGMRLALGEVVQAGGKHVVVWAVRGDLDADTVVSNRFEMEWPPRSGRQRSFPEIDRALWVPLPEARAKLVPAQAEFLARLEAVLDETAGEVPT